MTPQHTPAEVARQGGPRLLAQALIDARRDTLLTFAAFEAALPGLRVPQHPQLNPPLWELGHLGWFQAYWLARNPDRHAGWRADPDAPRHPAARADADALYDSGQVAHASRWSLPLPDADATRRELQDQLDVTLALLDNSEAANDEALYFFRLALLHEDMHHEAALYTAQSLGIPITDPRWQAPVLPPPALPLKAPGRRWALGATTGRGFAFDNELGALEAVLAPFTIDTQVLRWQEYLPFVESGAYDDRAHWTPAGWQWRAQQPRHGDCAAPRYLRREGGRWERWRHGQWQALSLCESACHLSFHEAQAWCQWAGRRLPTEAEWDCAAHTLGESFRWGDVWEWTASAFAPYPGFAPHPYRDYSAPWFDGRPVLRGASFMTQPRMRYPRYRNFFEADRNDLAAGLRTCAL